MSGLVAILQKDGSAVDGALLGALTDFLRFRGPDARRTWREGAAGFGHTLLRTTRESATEHQPLSLDGSVWITAEARVDAREELVEALARASSAGQRELLASPDVELILRAYLVWEENCVEKLLGDFAFVVWDGRKRRLFAARDHFGVKPLFYADLPATLLLSNTLDCLRLHPQVSNRLDDRFIGDFLLAGMCYDPTSTAFTDIWRLAPAHALTWSAGEGTRLRRYWTLPIEEPLRYRRTGDYLEEFRALLRAAVRDRLRTDRISISLSGGLDSPSVAAMACALLGPEAAADAVKGVTMVHDRVIPDDERYYSGAVSRHLGIETEYIAVDGFRLFEGCGEPAFREPEPGEVALAAVNRERLRRAGQYSRVLLTGEGGDPGLTPDLAPYWGRRFPLLLWETAKYAASHGRHPRVGFRLACQRRLGRWLGAGRAAAPLPLWLSPDFERRANLRERWQEICSEPASRHPFRPTAHRVYEKNPWPATFAIHESPVPPARMEARHPLFDLRLVQFFLRLPTLPWCADKELLRLAMRGALPGEILRRPKAPLSRDPVAAMLREPEFIRGVGRFAPARELAHYVVPERVPSFPEGCATGDCWVNLRPLCLNYWLQHCGCLEYIASGEGFDGAYAESAGAEKAL